MKRIVLTMLLAGVLLLPAILRGQVYQLPNAGFEQWDGTASDDEPVGWNSFGTSECTLSFGCAMAQTTHHENSSAVRPGSTGSHSCRIYATSIFGVVANGNITTGRIHAGSTTASSSSNYNVTYPSQNGFNQTFNGKPDYMRFWAKGHMGSSSSKARMNTIVHSNGEVRDPIISSDNNKIVGVATLNFTCDDSWHEYTVPFDYSYGGTTAQYILITFSTNMTPGGGNDGDEVYFDDIEMVYISSLSDLKSNGATVAGFSASTLEYSIELPYGAALPTVTATPTSVNGVVNITQPTEANPNATIVVTQGPSSTTYIIHYTFAAPQSANIIDIQLNGTTINNYNVTPLFDVNILNYSVRLPFGSTYPTVTATLELEAAEMSITQPTEEAPSAVIAVTCGALAKTYTVNFVIEPENDASLADLRLDGVTIAGFDPERTEYTKLLLNGAPIPVVSATATSEYASIVITQATEQNPTATVTVTSGPLTMTYTVEFTIADANCPLLLQLNVNGVLVAGFDPLVFNYTHTLPFGTSLADVAVSATTISPNAQISAIILDTTTYVNVTCGDSSATYTLQFLFAPEITADLSDLRTNGTTVIGFDPAITAYNEVVFGEEFPIVDATARSSAGELTITQATIDNPTATVLVTCSGLSKTYSINFIVAEPNADLADLQINGLSISGFDAATTEYEYQTEATLGLPVVSATAASPYATVAITQATADNMTATVNVTCGEAAKTYTVQFSYIDGIAEEQSSTFAIFPNPTDELLHISAEAGDITEIRIYSVTGQLVHQQRVLGEITTMDVSTLRPGLYIIRLIQEDAVAGTQKFLKR